MTRNVEKHALVQDLRFVRQAIDLNL